MVKPQNYTQVPRPPDEMYRDMVQAYVESEPMGTHFLKADIVANTGLTAAQVSRGIHYYRNVLDADRTVAFIQLGRWEYYLTPDLAEVKRYQRNQLRRSLTALNTLEKMLTVVVHGKSKQATVGRLALKQLTRMREDVMDTLATLDA